MTPDIILYFAKTAISLMLFMSLPVIVAVTAVGLVIALLQTLIQLQEQTLAFACKLVTLVVVVSFSGDWLSNEIVMYLENIFARIAEN